MIEHYRADHPESTMCRPRSCFPGHRGESAGARQRNSRPVSKNFILGYKKRGVIEIGYDGADEPTYENRPMVRQIDNETAQERWLMRAAADEKLLTEELNPRLLELPSQELSEGCRQCKRSLANDFVHHGRQCRGGTSESEGRSEDARHGLPTVSPRLAIVELFLCSTPVQQQGDYVWPSRIRPCTHPWFSMVP